MGIIYLYIKNKMKFIAIAALIATAQAAVGEDCGDDGTKGVCEDTECCGTATPAEESTAEEPIKVCQTDSLTEYVNADDEEATYTFACDKAAGSGAAKLIASALLLLQLLILCEH